MKKIQFSALPDEEKAKHKWNGVFDPLLTLEPFMGMIRCLFDVPEKHRFMFGGDEHCYFTITKFTLLNAK